MEEIEKLRLKVEKDPNSRLFLPLAEEYRKTGMLDEAINVILRGLEYQPGYTSARVALGRLYLERDMIEEARNEFEDVVKAIPDNLFSHKKLAEIYKAGGHIDMAVREYKKVIELNPLDDDARMCLDEIEGKPGETEAVIPLTDDTVAVAVGEEDEASFFGGEVDLEAETLTEARTDDFEKFEASFSAPTEAVEDAKDFFRSEAEEVGTDDISASQAEDIEDGIFALEAKDDVIELPEDAVFDDVFVTPSAETVETVKASTPILSESASAASLSGYGVDIAAADALVAEGNYYKAMGIYRKILAENQDNKNVLQRVSELKALLKLLGKSDEELIGRLDALLGAVKKNFSRSH